MRARDDGRKPKQLRTIGDVAGIFRDRVRGKSHDWEIARGHAEATVARQVADE